MTPSDEPAPRPEKSHQFGRYTLLEKLGKGGMGAVYKAWDPQRNAHVAIKCMLETDDPVELKRFLREASTATSLSHPNICTVYEISEHENTPYIVMELIDGQSLARRLAPRSRDEKRMPLRDAVTVVRDIAKALHHAHDHGIIHRDVKPENIMITDAGVAKLMDFGLAREIRHGATLTATGSAMGTPYYMSPEQAAGRKGHIDRRTDIWSLGVMLYQIAAHRMPFDGDTPAEILHKVVTEEPRSPRATDARVPHDLDTVIMKCLEPDPSHRYATAAAMAADLDRWLAGRPVSARPPTLTRRFAKRLRKSRALVIGLGAGVVAVVVALAILLPTLGRARKEASAAHEAALGQLRQTAGAALAAALGFRQQGRIPEMERYLKQTEEACRAAMAQFPDAAEPHYLLGRMYRAMMRDDEAFNAQEEALKRDANFAPARYEHALLTSRRYFARVEQLLADYWRDAGARGHFTTAHPRLSEVAHQDLVTGACLRALEHDLQNLRADRIGDGEAAFVSGLAAWTNQEHDTAAEFFREAIVKNPYLEEAYESLASLAAAQWSFEAAVRWCTAGLERDRGYVPHLERRAESRLDDAGVRLTRAEDPAAVYEAAVADLQAALRLMPSRTRARAMLAHACVSWGLAESDRGRSPEDLLKAAIGDLDGLLAAGEQGADIWMHRGMARMFLADWIQEKGGNAESSRQAGTADLEEARRRDPQNHLVGYRLGKAYGDLAMRAANRGEDARRLFELSIDALSEAIKLQSPDPRPWMARGERRTQWGVLKMLRGEDVSTLYEQARSDYDQAVERAPGQPAVRVERAMIRMNWGSARDQCGQDPMADFDAAVAELRQIVRESPTNDLAWRIMGVSSRNAGIVLKRRNKDAEAQFSDAVKSLGKAIELNPGRGEYWSDRGDARLQLGLWRLRQGKSAAEELDGSLTDCTHAIELGAGNASAWFGRAEVRFALSAQKYNENRQIDVEGFRGALDDFTHAINLNPSLLQAEVERKLNDCKRLLAEAGK